MKILVVEDSPTLGRGICLGLSKQLYSVELASDGEIALDMIYEANYDLIVLDLSLPFISGWEVLNEVRKIDQEIKILILTANNFVEDKVLGLDSGANDYLTKPFEFIELEARIRSLLRQKFITNPSTYIYENIKLDTQKKIVKIGEKVLKLTKKEYGILEYLLVNKEIVISIEDLIEHVWGEERNPFSNAYKYQLYSLRKKINDVDPKTAKMIKTVRGQGYMLNNKN